MAAMYACTGASPSALAICGFPPESSFGFALTRLRAVLFATFADLFAGIFLSGAFFAILRAIAFIPRRR
jgi:hypothetical protein